MIKQNKKKLYILSGPPASGKSTWIKNNLSKLGKDETRVISRDEIRFFLVKEDEPYFSREKEVYTEFIRLIKKYINMPEVNNIIVDATHLNSFSRNKLFRSIGTDMMNVDLYAIAFELPLDILLERNAGRKGREFVPETAIKNMYNSYSRPKLDEGFKEIYVYNENGLEKAITKGE